MTDDSRPLRAFDAANLLALFRAGWSGLAVYLLLAPPLMKRLESLYLGAPTPFSWEISTPAGWLQKHLEPWRYGLLLICTICCAILAYEWPATAGRRLARAGTAVLIMALCGMPANWIVTVALMMAAVPTGEYSPAPDSGELPEPSPSAFHWLWDGLLPPLAIAVVMTPAYMGRSWLDVLHESNQLGPIQTMLSGGLPVIDVLGHYGPLTPMLLRLHLDVFGMTVLQERVHLVAIQCCVLWFTYAWGRWFFRSRKWAVLVTVVLAVRSAAFYTLVDSFWGWANLARAGLATMVVWPLEAAFAGGGWLPACSAGAVLGVSLFYSQEYGACAVVALAITCLQEILYVGLYRRYRELLGLLAGLAITVLIVMVPYWYRNQVVSFIQALPRYPVLMASGQENSPFPDFPIGRGPRAVLHWLLDDNLVHLLGPIVTVIGGVAVWHAWRRGQRRRGDTAILYLCVLSALAYRSALGRSQAPATMMALAPASLLFVFLLCRLHRAHGSPFARGRPPRLVLVWMVAAVYFSPEHCLRAVRWGVLEKVRVLVPQLRAGIEEFHFPPSRMERTGALFMPPDQLRDVTTIVEWIRTRKRPGDTLFCFPLEGIYYFLTDMKPAVHFTTMVHAGSSAFQDELVKDLQANRPRFVILTPEGGEYDVQLRKHYKRIYDHVAAHYQQVRQVSFTSLMELRERVP
jgi:hypothetical protein